MEVRNPYVAHLRYVKAFITGGDDRCADMFLVERVFLAALCLVMIPTPGTAIRWLGGLSSRRTRKILVELYVVAKALLAVFILSTDLWTKPLASWIAIVCLVELFLNLAAVIFLREFWRRPISSNRSLILSAFNFAEFTAWFACLYLYCGVLTQGRDTITSNGAAYYFSVVTAATVGYGDITPKPGLGRVLTVVEILLAVGFLATVIAYFVSLLGEVKYKDEEKKLPD